MNKEFSTQLDALLNGQALSEQQAYTLMHKLADGDMPAAMAGAFLAGLRAKGETAEEIRGFATAMPEPVHRHGFACGRRGRTRRQTWQPIRIEQVRQCRHARVPWHAASAACGRGDRLSRGNPVYFFVRSRLSPGDEGDHAGARCAVRPYGL